LTHQLMRNNDIHFSCGSTDDVYCDGCNNLDTSDRFGKDIDVQVVRNNNLFSDYDDDNNNLLYHLDSISSIPDPYSNRQWKTYCGECHMKAKINAPDPLDYLDSICLNPDPLKRAHSPQGMLSLIDPTGCCVMEMKDGECPDPEVKLYHQGAHQQRYLGKPLVEIDYVWGDNESMSNSPTVSEAKLYKRQQWSYQSSYHKLVYPAFHQAGNTAALFLDDTLEVDVSIAEGSIFGILGSEKLSNYCYILAVKQSEKPMNGMHVCGQAIVETSMYYSEKTTTGTIGTVQYSKSYGKKTTTGTVGIVRYSKRSKVQ